MAAIVRVALVPILIEGAARAWQPGAFTVEGRHEIRITVGEAVSADDVKAAEVEALAERVRKQLSTSASI